MIRLIFILFYIIYIIAATPFLLCYANIVAKKSKEKSDTFCVGYVKHFFRCIMWISGVKLTVKGVENIPDNEPVLYVGNHRGFFDIISSYIYTKGVTGIVAKKEMIKVPILRNWMRHIYCLFLDRENPKEGLKMILSGVESIKSGTSIMIYPEGTRNASDTVLPFKEGSFKMAQKSGCKIIPMALCNTESVLENHFPLIKSSEVILEFGNPVDMANLAPEHKKFVGAYVQNQIQEMYNANHSQLFGK